MKHSSLSRRGVWLLALVVLGVGAPVVGFLWSRAASGTPSLSKETGASKSAHPTSTPPEGVVCFGHVDLEHGVTPLYPLQPGRVVKVPIREGEQVAEGTVLVCLEDGPARSRLAEAEAGLDVAQLQLARARKLPEQQRSRIAQQEDSVEVMRYKLAAARRMAARKQKLADQRLIDADEPIISEDHVRELEALERAEKKRLADLKREDPQEDVRRAEKEVAIAKARVDQARFALNDCTVKAPGRGTALRIMVGPGDVLSGQPKQPAVLFAAEGPLVIRAEVEQEFVGRVAVGMAVRVEDEFDPEKSWPGKVERVARWFSQRRSIMNEPSELNDVRTVECLIKLDSDQMPLRLGQRVRVKIGMGKAE